MLRRGEAGDTRKLVETDRVGEDPVGEGGRMGELPH